MHGDDNVRYLSRFKLDWRRPLRPLNLLPMFRSSCSENPLPSLSASGNLSWQVDELWCGASTGTRESSRLVTWASDSMLQVLSNMGLGNSAKSCPCWCSSLELNNPMDCCSCFSSSADHFDMVWVLEPERPEKTLESPKPPMEKLAILMDTTAVRVRQRAGKNKAMNLPAWAMEVGNCPICEVLFMYKFPMLHASHNLGAYVEESVKGLDKSRCSLISDTGRGLAGEDIHLGWGIRIWGRIFGE